MKPFRTARPDAGAPHARSQFYARDRAAQARRYDRQAQAAMPALVQSYREQHPEGRGQQLDVRWYTASEDVTGNLRPAFITLLAAVSAVLLIACSNVANLLLVRLPAAGVRSLCAWRSGAARQWHRALVRLREHAGQRDRGRSSDCASRSGQSRSFRNLPAIISRSKAESHCIRRCSFHVGPVASHWSAHGTLSGVAKFARRSGRWT